MDEIFHPPLVQLKHCSNARLGTILGLGCPLVLKY